MTGNVVKLRPDESPFGKAFMNELREVIQTHMDRGELTYGEIIGILELEKLAVASGEYDE